MKRFVGLDAGSVSVKLAVIDGKGSILETRYVRHKGKPLAVALELLSGIQPSWPLGLTGTAGRLIADILGLNPVNEIVAQTYSTRTFYPEVRSVIEMGGEDSKVILLQDGKVKEFSMNSVCAAGTGSFLDQQAERLNLSIEEFSEIALESKNPPRIAGRCSVFAKSDMIHLQQIATPLKDIVAGLCFAVARNFKGSICKNMEVPEPVSFQGGVAANRGVVRAFREVFHLDSLIIPEHFALMPAIGVALKNREEGGEAKYDISRLKSFIEKKKHEQTEGHKPLAGAGTRISNTAAAACGNDIPETSGKIPAYLGIDIGSISTNLAVIDGQGRLLAKRYLMTAGRPIEAVQQGLDEIGKEIGDRVEVLCTGTTGSGRYMIADFVGADIVKNEITAQAQAAVEIDPRVDTIFEIGGQDSKYISLKDGIIVDFEMNKACAAGTGSFLEEQAEKLGISIKEEFSELAFQSQCPSSLGERCTVFMENSLLTRQQRGVPKEDLVAGLSYSIVQNYVNRVVGDRKIGDRIFFQGGTAFNSAVVAAFEKFTGRRITVPPNHDVTGAIGMAIIAMKHRKTLNAQTGTKFKGFDLSKRKYEINSFECKGCDNICEINRVTVEGEKDPLFYGSRCEKYDVKRKDKYFSIKKQPDLFAEREALLTKAHREYKDKSDIRNEKSGTASAVRIGIPRIFFFHDFLPFWSTLLWELGFEVETSGETKRHLINKGVESILSESCFPHKVAHGHIRDLIEKGVDAILIPSFINLNDEISPLRGLACPYAQTMPYVANVAFRGEKGVLNQKIRLLKPIVNLSKGKRFLTAEIHRSLKSFGISLRAVQRAFEMAEKAQEEFITAIKKRGREVLNNVSGRAIVILGRSYNAFDSGVNLEIPKKLSTIGVFSIPMDFLPLEEVDIHTVWPNMYWRSGQNLLRAAEIIRDNPHLFALYIGNFSCGPDSFIQRFFKETLAGKPYLHIEIDEHSADAGVITRCEAFLDSITNRKIIPVKKPRRPKNLSIHSGQKKIVYIAKMSDHAYGVAAAFQSCGVDAEVMDTPDAETVKLGRKYVSGKECYPCAITTGDMVKRTMSSDFDPSKAAFFMPSGSGPCRFGQYNILHRYVLDEIGLSSVPIFAPNQDTCFYKELGIVGSEFTKRAWKGIVATDLLTKCLHSTRPYEENRGEADNIYQEYLKKIVDMVKSRNGASHTILHDMKKDFQRIPRTNGGRPLIGIIGEIFVRLNSFANENVVRKVEALGGEAWLAPMEEWIFYVNAMAARKALSRWRKNFFSKKCLDEMLSVYLTNFYQKKIEHHCARAFEGYLSTLHEPSTKELFRNASPYVHDSFEGETILSIGKAVDLVKKGASGIISVMPFGCMPGTIVDALLKGIKKDTGIPFLSIAYDGNEANCSEIQMEAFMHQADEYGKTMETGEKE